MCNIYIDTHLCAQLNSRVTPTPPTEMFDSTVFILLIRIFLPLVNLLGFVVAFEALASHLHRLLTSSFSSKLQKQSAIRMAVGSGIQSCSKCDNHNLACDVDVQSVLRSNQRGKD